MNVLDGVIADLAAEGDQLRAVIVDLDDAAWQTATPAVGWTIADTIGHLAWTDEVAVLAAAVSDVARRTEAGKQWDAVVLSAIEDPTGFVDTAAHEFGSLSPEQLLGRWDAGRSALVQALQSHPEGEKLPWFGPPMSPASMATARFMETWAHALDVYDALADAGAAAGRPAPTDRIKHVAHIGVRTRNYAFANNELEAPGEEFRVELVAPSGETWSWGPAEAAQRVTGTADDFCQLVTQRVHRDDTDLIAVGDDAATWLTIAQAFAGPAGGGREKKS